MLSALELEKYQSEGIIKVKLSSEVIALKKQLADQIAEWLFHWGKHKVDPTDLNSGLQQIALVDRAMIGKLYKVSRRFPAAKALACSSSFVEISKQAMNTNLVSCCNFVCVRIDLPTEDKYMLPVHQDFPYIQGSENGLTFWTSLGDTDLEMGPPSFLPESHKFGVLKVQEKDLSSTYGKNGGSTIEIVAQNELKSEEFRNVRVMQDEALLFSTLLVHKSEPNLSQRARVSLQLRFDDMTCESSFNRNYPDGLYLGNSFKSNYSEHVVES